jgi:type VI secretion system ImpM family protein
MSAGMSAFSAGSTSLVGKLPSQAEFLPTPSGAPGFAAFDAWLTSATEWAAGRAGPSWPDHFAKGTIHAFAFRPPAAEPGTLLCGALAPSRDSAGRQFPLVVAAPLRVSRELAELPQLLPFVLEGFWGNATALLWDLLAGAATDPRAACAALHAEPVLDAQEAAALYAEWSSELELRELWPLLGPPLEGPAPAGPLRLVAEVVAPFRGVEQPDTPLSLRLPLGLAGGAALCFWLDVLRRSLGWRSTVPSFFWSHDGQWGAGLFHLGRPSKQALAELWMPTGQREEICDLTEAPSQALVDALPPLPPAVQAVLESPGATVSDLLELLQASAA